MRSTSRTSRFSKWLLAFNSRPDRFPRPVSLSLFLRGLHVVNHCPNAIPLCDPPLQLFVFLLGHDSGGTSLDLIHSDKASGLYLVHRREIRTQGIRFSQVIFRMVFMLTPSISPAAAALIRLVFCWFMSLKEIRVLQYLG